MGRMDRYWLLTWTTYGTWLPGDRRGFVSDLRDAEGTKVRHNEPGTPCDADLLGLQHHSRSVMKAEPILLDVEQAHVLLEQLKETARFRGWSLIAVAIMANHVHLVVAVPGDPEPTTLLQSFKAYGSRALSRRFGKPPAETWRTESGSVRKLK